MVGILFGVLMSASAFAGDDLSKVAGYWQVPSGLAGRTTAVYMVDPKGNVITVLPVVNGKSPDAPMHLMNGGKFSVDKKVPGGYRFKSDIFALYAQAMASKPDLGKQFEKAASDGVPFHLDSSVTPPKMIYDVDPPLKNWFPDNSPMADAEVEKSIAARETERGVIESAPWTILGTADCTDDAFLKESLDSAPAEMFDHFFKPGSTLKFNRKGDELSAVSSADPSARLSYYGSYLERSVGLVWFKGKQPSQMNLVDQGTEADKPGVHRFRVNVNKTCKEITMSNGQTTNGTAGVAGKTPVAAPAPGDGQTSGKIQ